jgi:hypothetical protein
MIMALASSLPGYVLVRTPINRVDVFNLVNFYDEVWHIRPKSTPVATRQHMAVERESMLTDALQIDPVEDHFFKVSRTDKRNAFSFQGSRGGVAAVEPSNRIKSFCATRQQNFCSRSDHTIVAAGRGPKGDANWGLRPSDRGGARKAMDWRLLRPRNPWRPSSLP